MAILGAVVGGCGSPSGAGKKKPAEPDKPPIPAQTVNLSAGNGTAYGIDKKTKKRSALWHIQWKKGAQASLTGQGDLSQGTLEGVSGYILDGDRPGTTFTADHGAASTVPTRRSPNKGRSKNAAEDTPADSRTVNRLTLSGHVHLKSPPRPSSKSPSGGEGESVDLYCDGLIYDAEAKRFRAQGHVTLVSNVGTVGPMSQLWATPDLKTAATPNMFPANPTPAP